NISASEVKHTKAKEEDTLSLYADIPNIPCGYGPEYRWVVAVKGTGSIKVGTSLLASNIWDPGWTYFEAPLNLYAVPNNSADPFAPPQRLYQTFPVTLPEGSGRYTHHNASFEIKVFLIRVSRNTPDYWISLLSPYSPLDK